MDNIFMYDLACLYRVKSSTEALNKLRITVDKYVVLVDFARESEIDDPLLKEREGYIISLK